MMDVLEARKRTGVLMEAELTPLTARAMMAVYLNYENDRILQALERKIRSAAEAQEELLNYGLCVVNLNIITGEEEFRQLIQKEAAALRAQKRGADGRLLAQDGGVLTTREAAFLLPFYAAEETKFETRERYADIVSQLRFLYQNLLQSASGQDENGFLRDASWFLWTAAETGNQLLESVYEYYAEIRKLQKDVICQCQKLAAQKGQALSEYLLTSVSLEDCCIFAAGIARSCKNRMLLSEKYRGDVDEMLACLQKKTEEAAPERTIDELAAYTIALEARYSLRKKEGI